MWGGRKGGGGAVRGMEGPLVSFQPKMNLSLNYGFTLGDIQYYIHVYMYMQKGWFLLL